MNRGFFGISKKWAYVSICVILTFILIGIFMMGKSGEHKSPLRIDDSLVPTGWYSHTLSEGLILLIPSQTLSEIGDTELMAYGEQILVGSVPFPSGSVAPEEWEYLSWTDDTAMVRERKWLTIQGSKALRIEHEAGGASGGSLTYYIFKDQTAHVLSLYPFDESKHIEIFEAFVSDYAKSLQTNCRIRKACLL